MGCAIAMGFRCVCDVASVHLPASLVHQAQVTTATNRISELEPHASALPALVELCEELAGKEAALQAQLTYAKEQLATASASLSASVAAEAQLKEALDVLTADRDERQRMHGDAEVLPAVGD